MFWSARLARMGGVAHRVLHTTNSVLRVAFRLLDLSFGPGLAVARNRPDCLLDGALGPFCATCNPILVHDSLWARVTLAGDRRFRRCRRTANPFSSLRFIYFFVGYSALPDPVSSHLFLLHAGAR